MGNRQDRWVALVPLLALPLLTAYPPLEWRAAAWVGLAPLLWLLKHGPGSPTAWFGAGWGFGALFYAVQYAWLGRTMVELGGLPLPRFALFSAIGLGLVALLPAAAFALSRWSWQRLGVSPYLSFPLLYCLTDALLGVAPFEGAPWGSLAGTQTPALAAVLLAPLAGGSAVVLAVAGVNGCWAWWAEGLRRGGWSAARRASLPFVVTLVAAPSWPAVDFDGAEARALRAVLIPGNFTNAAPAEEGFPRFRGFVARSLAASGDVTALAEGAADGKKSARTLIVWPEAAAEGHVARGKRLVEVFKLGRLLDADFLLGSDASERGREFNSAYLVTGDRFDFRRYDKRVLVPFGEYVPVGFRWLFGKKLTAGETDYAPGGSPPVIPWREHVLGVAICFESILPGHMRRAAQAGAGLVVGLANDHWLTPAARLQHLRLTALRGLEIGRDVLFVSNGGWSAHLAGPHVPVLGDWQAPPGPAYPALRAGLTPWVRWGYLPLAGLLAGWVVLGLMPGCRRGAQGGRGLMGRHLRSGS
jgi:apolipoprotein N-acyltransferase